MPTARRLTVLTLLMACKTPAVEEGAWVDQLLDVAATPVDPANIGADDLLLDRLEVVVSSEATSEDMVEALALVDGTIAAANPGLPFVSVHIPPGDEASALAAARALAAHPAITYAGPTWLAAPPQEPDQLRLAPPDPGGSENRYLGDQRFFGAWNAHALATNRVPVYVGDSFTDTAAHAQLSAMRFVGPDFTEELAEGATNYRGNHGLWVASLLGADADAVAPVGTHPDPVKTLDLIGVQTVQLGLVEALLTLDRVMPRDAPFVLNTSFGYNTNAPPLTRVQGAHLWRAVVRTRPSGFLHLTSAGNEGYPDLASTQANSPFSLQAVVPDLLDWLPPDDRPAFQQAWDDAATWIGADRDRTLGTTLAVGASDSQGDPSTFSNFGADIRMRGEFLLGVCGQPDSGCNEGLKRANGTSGASPLAAGLGAWLLSIDPTLTPPEAADILRQAFNGSTVDALNATLALEARGIPVRRALLDVVEDGRFDEQDITSLLSNFDVTEAGQPTALQENRVWSRYDLNGDGHARSDTPESFDLDGDGTYGDVIIQVPGAAFGETRAVTLNENALTDLDILCWATFDGTYEGDPDALGPIRERCHPPEGGRVTWTQVQKGSLYEITTTVEVTLSIGLDGTLEDAPGTYHQLYDVQANGPYGCTSTGERVGTLAQLFPPDPPNFPYEDVSYNDLFDTRVWLFFRAIESYDSVGPGCAYQGTGSFPVSEMLPLDYTVTVDGTYDFASYDFEDNLTLGTIETTQTGLVVPR